MKVAVINRSGNAGKTTISRHLLAPRMNNSPIISFESTNLDGKEKIVMRGNDFGKLSEALVLVDDIIVDIGSSNIEDFTNLMMEYQGSHEDLDFYVVPTTTDPKILDDTVKTLTQLQDFGVPASKIRLIFMRLERKQSLEREFSGIFNYHNDFDNFILNKDAVVYESELFTRIHDTELLVSDIINDETDYLELIKHAKNSAEKLNLVGF
jgi:cellulose biosynthesis protein BcsQ